MKPIAPKPHPATKKLGYFVGKWVVKGDIPHGPWGAGGKCSWIETTKWMRGKFFVVGRWNFQMPKAFGGNGEELFIIGYNSARRAYTFNAFGSQGLHQVSMGFLKGDTWTWDSEGTQAGQRARQRMTMHVFSPKRYTLKFEVSNDGKTWATFMNAIAVKQ